MEVYAAKKEDEAELAKKSLEITQQELTQLRVKTASEQHRLESELRAAKAEATQANSELAKLAMRQVEAE